jgi:hypothetical protein
MRSFDPSSRVTVPPPAQLPAIPANGPDCAWPAEVENDATQKTAAAISSRRIIKRASTARLELLP